MHKSETGLTCKIPRKEARKTNTQEPERQTGRHCRSINKKVVKSTISMPINANKDNQIATGSQHMQEEQGKGATQSEAALMQERVRKGGIRAIRARGRNGGEAVKTMS